MREEGKGEGKSKGREDEQVSLGDHNETVTQVGRERRREMWDGGRCKGGEGEIGLVVDRMNGWTINFPGNRFGLQVT